VHVQYVIDTDKAFASSRYQMQEETMQQTKAASRCSLTEVDA
jgi:hypothetical protein